MPKETLVGLLDYSVETYGDRTAIKSQITGEQWTYKELRECAYRVSGSLLEKKVEKGDRIVLISENTPEFVFANYGILYTGATVVPVDEKLRPEDLYSEYFNHVKPKLIIVERKHADKIRKYVKDIPVVLLEDLLYDEAVRPNVEINEDDIAAIIFSSGTTSDSDRAFKEPMLSHKNIASNIIATRKLPKLAEDRDGAEQGVYLAGVGKQWHSFEYMMQQALLYAGCLLHYTNFATFRRVMKSRKKEERETDLGINPHYILMIPVVADTLMGEIKSNVEKMAPQMREKIEKKYSRMKYYPVIKWLMDKLSFEYCLENSMEYHYQWTNNRRCSLKRFLIDQIGARVYYKKIREGLKGKLGNSKPYFIGGSAPLALETAKFFGAIRVLIYQGYGQTETGPVVSVNTPGNYYYGSSGPVIEGTEVLIADAEYLEKEGKIREVKKGREGVILVRGTNVFKGYYGDLKKTEEAFIEGWLNTGDIGSISARRHLFWRKKFLNVLGRVGDLICRKGGEKKLATPIESYYRAQGVDGILVGNNQERFGLLVIVDDNIREQAQDLKFVQQYCREHFADSTKRFGVKFFSDNVRFISRTDFDAHPELVTNTMKRRRRIIEQVYESRIREACNSPK